MKISITHNEYQLERIAEVQGGNVEVIFNDGPSDGVIVIDKKIFASFVEDWLANQMEGK